MLSDTVTKLGLAGVLEAIWGIAPGIGEAPPAVLTLAAVCVALAFVAAVSSFRSRRARRRALLAETAFAEKFGRADLRLEDVPTEFAELDRRIASLMQEIEDLKRNTRNRLGLVPRSPLLDLLARLQKDAADEVAKLAMDEQFMRIDKVLQISRTLADIEMHLAQPAKADISAVLLAELETADVWNAALTSPCIFEAYFGEVPALKPLSRRLRAIELVMRSAFLGLDVDIVVKHPFSKIEGTEPATRTRDAPRDLSRLTEVRERATQEMRSIADRSGIVIDCFAPGWNSARIGSSPPRFTIYDPGS
jgi:hypothetical protein